MSEGMKKIEAAIANTKVLDPLHAEAVQVALMLLMSVCDAHDGLDLKANIETAEHRYTLTLTREAM